MKDKNFLKEEKLDFNKYIKEKDIEKGGKFKKTEKKLFLFLAASIFIVIMAILIISSSVGYTN